MTALSGSADTTGPESRYMDVSRRFAVPVFSCVLVAFTFWAWTVRGHHYLQAESGLGYWLGITGGSLMLLLLLYPLGKRWVLLRRWMQLKHWFRMHMLLGVLGPLCILLHCNFQWGSANSSVALLAMLLVSSSGLMGRYFYGKFHYGLYGAQVEMGQLKADIEEVYAQLDPSASAGPELTELYQGCCDIISSQQGKVSYRRLFSQRRWLRQKRRQALRAAGKGAAGKTLVEPYLALAGILDKLAGVRLFERLFGLWHVVHIPVFLLMVVTAIVHVFVVHWY